MAKKTSRSRNKRRDGQEQAGSLQYLFPVTANLPFGEVDAEALILYDPGDPRGALPSVKGDYVVIFDERPFARAFNPSGFSLPDLPDDPCRKVFYELNFRGRQSEDSGGLIVPSDALRYMLAICGKACTLNPAMARVVLRKLGFSGTVLQVNQDPPLDKSRESPRLFLHKLRFHVAWNTLLPVVEARDPSLKKLFFMREHPLFRMAFLVLAVAIFVLLPILSLDAGLSGDDEKHYEHATKVYRYFTEHDPAALNDPQHKLNYYGQSFDFFTYLVIRIFNLGDSPYEARHVMVALAGAAAILFTGLLVKLFAGYSGGALALVLMFLSPRFLGHSFNNSMDVPFALGNIFTLYYIILFLKKLPGFSVRFAVLIALGIAWTNGIRIGGFLLVPYLFMFSGLYLLLHPWPWKPFSKGWWTLALKGLGILVAISLSGYLLSLLTWPYALQDIIRNPIESFRIMTNIQVSIRVLYDGLVQWSDNLPWHYIPKNVLLTVPVLVLLGWIASLATWVSDRKEGNGYWYFLLWFTVLFPVIFIIIRRSNVYGGWRHMMFIYPSMVALSAMALGSLIGRLRKNWARYAAGAMVAAGLIHPLKHIIRNHPDTYIYFNELSGGINRVAGTFETDYYACSFGPATSYFIESILPGLQVSKEQPVQVISNFSINYYFRKHPEVQCLYSRYYDLGKRDWDYAILYSTFVDPYQLNHGLWPPKNTIYEQKVDDVVVTAIVERKNREDYFGSVLLDQGMEELNGAKLEQARVYLEHAVEYDPYNVEALLDLSNVYIAFLEFDLGRQTLGRLLEFYPDYDYALNTIGYSYLVEAEYLEDYTLLDQAVWWMNKALQSNYKFYSAYYNLGLCYGLKDDRDHAIYYFEQAIKYNYRFIQAYDKLAEIYDIYGEPELAEMVREQSMRWR
jgi:tetratricopeptide (TPR) repeat protein